MVPLGWTHGVTPPAEPHVNREEVKTRPSSPAGRGAARLVPQALAPKSMCTLRGEPRPGQVACWPCSSRAAGLSLKAPAQLLLCDAGKWFSCGVSNSSPLHFLSSWIRKTKHSN